MSQVQGSSRPIYRFDRFVLDLGRGALFGANGVAIALRPKSFKLLCLLVENAGLLLDHDTILAAVWPGIIVTDESIVQCIRDIRRALRDEARRLVRTIAKRGYILEAEVTSASEALPPFLAKKAPDQEPYAFSKDLLLPTAAPGRRRFMVILVADVVAYTSLMEAAEEATHARLKWLLSTIVEPAVSEYCGRIVKHTGDGFFAAFDNALNAVRCALLVQKNVMQAAGEPNAPTILFRMGVNSDYVIVESDDIFGSGVNLAVRLQASAEPGGIIVSEAIVQQLHACREIELTDIGALTLKNLQRPVRAFAVCTHISAPAIAALRSAPQDDRPSIAVLPFHLQSDGPGCAWFTEGIIEGIIHILSGIQDLFVISHGTAQAYASRVIDPRVLGRELGVRYVLSGSVHRVGNRLNIFTELTDAATGIVLRTNRYNGMIPDLFQMQDQIASQVVATLAPKVRERELARAMRKHPDSITGYDLVLQALDLLYRLDQECFDRARGLLQQAIALDPGYAPAYSHAATWHMFRIGQGISTNLAEEIAAAARYAAASLERDPENAVALAIHGHMLSFTQRDYHSAVHFLDHAILAGPSCHIAWTLSSATRGYLADGPGAVECAKRALQLSPFDPFAFFSEHMLSQAFYINGEYEEAVAWGRRAAVRNGLLTSNLRTLAAALVATGQIEKAREIARRMLVVQPNFRLSDFAARTPFKPEILEVHIPRLRLAGFPN